LTNGTTLVSLDLCHEGLLKVEHVDLKERLLVHLIGLFEIATSS
jgi:hypothetical protein